MKARYILPLFLFTFIHLLAQPSGEEFRHTAVIEENAINTVITNYATLGQPASIGPSGTWNGFDNVYFNDMSIVLGLELPIADYWRGIIPPDGIPDTIHSVIITPVDRPGGGENGWNFEPVDSFFNPNIADPTKGFALSNYSNTWPLIWPDHPEYGTGVWNGLFGPNSFIGSQEAYFKIDDVNDQENNLVNRFYPDSTDTTITGHGIKVFVRYVQLDNPLFKDLLFKIYDIKNESAHNYSKMVLGGLTGTYIGGGSPEYADDVSLYYFRDNFILSYDFDKNINPSANPNWEGDVGMFGEAFIHAPSNNKIASFQYFVPAGEIVMSDDEGMWNRMEPGFYDFPASVIIEDSVPRAIKGEDGDYIYASDYFSLDLEETKQIVSILAFGYTKSEIQNKIKIAEALYHSSFDTLAIHEKINLISHNYHRLVSGVNQIQWQAENNNGTVEIWYSPDGGNNWDYITKNAPNNGNYSWNTENFEDGSFALLKIFLKNEDGFIYAYDETDSYFTVNNTGNGTPFIKILNSEFSAGGTFTQKNYDFNLLVGDPEEDDLLLKVYYSLNNNTNFIHSQSFNVISDTISQIYNVDFNSIPNSQHLKVKLEVTDGESFYSDVTHEFDKQTPRLVLGGSNFEILSGHAQVPVEIRIIDSTKFRGYEYIITFEDTLWNEGYKTFSAFNTTLNEYAVYNKPFYPFAESIPFDGMVLYTEDIETEIDTIMSRWNHLAPSNLGYVVSRFSSSQWNGYKDPFDYVLTFSNVYNDSSNYLNQIFGQNAPPANYNINFKVYRVIDDNPERIQFAFTEPNNFRKDTLSFLDQITYSNTDGTELSWKVVMTGDLSSKIPSAGDTLYLFTLKGLSKYDSLRIFNLPADVENNENLPLSYSLLQNYPNPFNPNTKIRFEIPKREKVLLKIYDMLGRELTTLINEEKNAGMYEIIFDASKLASGVYFYRIQAGSFIKTKKMILLK